jgi:AraC-like DNA-binding protein
MFFIIGIIIATFLCCLLILKKKKEPADFILIAWIGIITIHLILFYGLRSELSYKYPHTLGLILPIPLLHQVLLYFYTIELTRKKTVTIVKILVHLIPFFILTGIAIPFFLLPPDQKVYIFQNNGKGFEWYISIQLMMILISGFGYTITSIYEIRNHRKRLQQLVSNTDKKMLRWLEYLVFGLGCIWFLSIFFSDSVILSAVVVFVFFIGFFGINQVPVFYTQWEIENKIPDNQDMIISAEPEDAAFEKPVSMYTKSGLTDKGISEIMERLEEMMKTEKYYKNNELTLNDLAKKMQIHPNNLSQAINSMTGKSFYHYINSWRINEFLAIASLPENKNYTLNALAFECGFNSKTTFNKYFKLQTGKTPSEHLNS